MSYLFVLLTVIAIGSSLILGSSVATSQTTLSDSTQWRYYVDASAVPTGWNTKGFVSTWSTSTLASMPKPMSVSAYYCASFDITVLFNMLQLTILSQQEGVMLSI